MNVLSQNVSKYFIIMLQGQYGYSMVMFLKVENDAKEVIVLMIGDFEYLLGSNVENIATSKRQRVRCLMSKDSTEHPNVKLQSWLE